MQATARSAASFNNLGGQVGSILRIAASKLAGTVEFVGESSGFCAIHYLSNATNIWILINEAGVGTTCDSNSDGSTDATDYVEVCLDGVTLEESAPASCATLKSSKTLTMIGRGAGMTADGLAVEAAATPSTESIDICDVSTANALNENAGVMAGVTDFH